jgi:hypothetical protein
MTFEEILDQAIAMLQRRGRLTYGALKRQFQLDDAALDDLKEQLLYAYPQVVDDAGHGLVWTDEPAVSPTTTPPTPQPALPGPPRTPHGVSHAWRHRALLCSVRVFASGSLPKRT